MGGLEYEHGKVVENQSKILDVWLKEPPERPPGLCTIAILK